MEVKNISDEILIRCATDEDISDLVILYERMYEELSMFDYPFSLNIECMRDILKTQISSKFHRIFVSEHKSKIAGFFSVGIAKIDRKLKKQGYPLIGNYYDMYVSQAIRRRSVASELLKYADIWLRENDIDMVEGSILIRNSLSLRFFEKNGLIEMSKILYKNLQDNH